MRLLPNSTPNHFLEMLRVTRVPPPWIICDVEFNFQLCFPNPNEEKSPILRELNSSYSLNIDDDNENSNTEVMFEMNASGHLSDPGTGKAKFWASLELKRSCSNLDVGRFCTSYGIGIFSCAPWRSCNIESVTFSANDCMWSINRIYCWISCDMENISFNWLKLSDRRSSC